MRLVKGRGVGPNVTLLLLLLAILATVELGAEASSKTEWHGGGGWRACSPVHHPNQVLHLTSVLPRHRCPARQNTIHQYVLTLRLETRGVPKMQGLP